LRTLARRNEREIGIAKSGTPLVLNTPEYACNVKLIASTDNHCKTVQHLIFNGCP